MIIMKFEMLIKEIFNFHDGRTVFVGDIFGNNEFIKECDCEILIDGQFFGKIHIEGEMLPCNSKSELRSVSTSSKIDVFKLPYKNKPIMLRCVMDSP